MIGFTINYENASGVSVGFWVFKSLTINPVAQVSQSEQKEIKGKAAINVVGYVSEDAYTSGKKPVQAKNLIIDADSIYDSLKETIWKGIESEKDFKDLTWQLL